MTKPNENPVENEKAEAAAAIKSAAAAAKAEKAVASAEAKTARLAVSAAKKEASASAKEAKLLAKEEKVQAKLTTKEAKVPIEQNGVALRKPGTKTGKVWEICDTLSGKMGYPTPVKEVLEMSSVEGLHPTTVRCQYALWKKFHGLTGRIEAPTVAA